MNDIRRSIRYKDIADIADKRFYRRNNMIFHRCDKCGKEIKRPLIVTYEVSEGFEVFGHEEHEIFHTEHIELCAECFRDFKEWMGIKE